MNFLSPLVLYISFTIVVSFLCFSELSLDFISLILHFF